MKMIADQWLSNQQVAALMGVISTDLVAPVSINPTPVVHDAVISLPVVRRDPAAYGQTAFFIGRATYELGAVSQSEFAQTVFLSAA